MKFSFRLKRVCGSVFSNGNLSFTPDGNSVLSPVGNLLSVFDLLQQSSYTLPFENKKNVNCVAVSHNGRFLISVDEDGHALFINLPRQVVLTRFNFKRRVYAIKFSPDDEMFAVTHGSGVQIWQTPSIMREFSPLTLNRTIAGHYDEATCLDWSSDSVSIIIGSKDLTARVYHRVRSKHMSMLVLSGHRDEVIGVYFAGGTGVKGGNSDGTSTPSDFFGAENLNLLPGAEMAYSVAVDGAVFTWQFELAERIPLPPGATRADTRRGRRPKRYPKMTDIRLGGGTSGEEQGSSDGEDDDSEDDTSGDHSDSAEDVKEAGNEAPVSASATADSNTVATRRGSRWKLVTREFLWDPHTTVSCVDFNRTSGLLVVGFTSGVFGLYEMPGCVNLHRLSVSSNRITSVSLNATGEWLAVGSARLGQLLVWEWKSESYVLKQQGHLYGLNAMDFSADGQLIATGGEDGKVKIWNTATGFCFVTFSEHTAPVSGVRFVGKGLGKALISSSLDGTVRAHDLLRYRNFRTLSTPDPVQLTCLAADASGELICAGSLDPFNIYVWALQTGKLLDVLAGHEGPIACLSICPETSVLASGSWDGTLKLWDVYNNTNTETMEHGCDVLAVAWRPDGAEICCATTNGTLNIWDVGSGTQVSVIEGRRDISGGRLTTDAVTADNAARSKYFTTVAYTSDGSCILAGGRSKYICLYVVATGVLIKKFQLSHNRSLEGILDELRSDQLVDGVALENLPSGAAAGGGVGGGSSILPGGGRSRMNDGSRTTRPEVVTTEVQFSPSGREWAAVSTQGMQIFGLDEAMLFAPTDLDIDITPQAVRRALSKQEYTLAVNIALHLGERDVLKGAADAVPIGDIELVVRSLDPRVLRQLLKFIAEEITASRHTEFYLQWCWQVVHTHAQALPHALTGMGCAECVRALLRAVTLHERDIMKMSDDNMFTLNFLRSQLQSQPQLLGQEHEGRAEQQLDPLQQSQSDTEQKQTGAAVEDEQAVVDSQGQVLEAALSLIQSRASSSNDSSTGGAMDRNEEVEKSSGILPVSSGRKHKKQSKEHHDGELTPSEGQLPPFNTSKTGESDAVAAAEVEVDGKSSGKKNKKKSASKPNLQLQVSLRQQQQKQQQQDHSTSVLRIGIELEPAQVAESGEIDSSRITTTDDGDGGGDGGDDTEQSKKKSKRKNKKRSGAVSADAAHEGHHWQQGSSPEGIGSDQGAAGVDEVTWFDESQQPELSSHKSSKGKNSKGKSSKSKSKSRDRDGDRESELDSSMKGVKRRVSFSSALTEEFLIPTLREQRREEASAAFASASATTSKKKQRKQELQGRLNWLKQSPSVSEERNEDGEQDSDSIFDFVDLMMTSSAEATPPTPVSRGGASSGTKKQTNKKRVKR